MQHSLWIRPQALDTAIAPFTTNAAKAAPPCALASSDHATQLLECVRLAPSAGSDPSKIPSSRYWTNYIGSRALSWMSGADLIDSQSGFRLLGADLARRLELRSRGYAIESEMLLKVARRGGRIGHAPVRAIYERDGMSHFRPVLDTARISCAAVYYKVFDDR